MKKQPLSKVIKKVKVSETAYCVSNETPGVYFTGGKPPGTEGIRTLTDEELSELKKEIYQEAKKDADLEATEQLKKRITEIQETFSQRLDEIIGSLESEIINLVVLAAKRVCEQEAIQNNDIIVSVVKTGLKELFDKDSVKVHVNPNDYPLVTKGKKALLESAPNIKSLELVSDERIERGGSFLDGGDVIVSAEVSDRIAQVKKKLLSSEEDEMDEAA